RYHLSDIWIGLALNTFLLRIAQIFLKVESFSEKVESFSNQQVFIFTTLTRSIMRRHAMGKHSMKRR
ncbi:MAG TPA: hypothetical protein VMC61_07530, partial [Methanocella sp.]|nr:hypothetical protein [Methanocella sp.]